MTQALPSSPAPSAVEALSIASSASIYCLNTHTLADVVAMFRANEDIRLLPIVDHAMRPVGAIHENDVRRILFNPYGHSLLSNPAFRTDLDAFLRPCPVSDASASIGELLDIYARQNGTMGLILTRHGRLWGTVSNRTLLALAAEREAKRNEAMSAVAGRFERQAGELSDFLRSASDTLARTASATAARSEKSREDANAAAAAASQVSAGMTALSSESDRLATALDELWSGVSDAKAASREAVEIVRDQRGKAERFARTADIMSDTLEVIRQLAQSINHLAFNARIEASRAGTSGSGFAVVAQEIKQFADRARAAAGDVARQLHDVRSTVEAVTTGHRGMERVIGSVDEMCRVVEQTIGDQRQLGQRLASDTRETADATESICRSIAAIQQASLDAASNAADMRDLSATLAQGSAGLHDRIVDYVTEMRAA